MRKSPSFFASVFFAVCAFACAALEASAQAPSPTEQLVRIQSEVASGDVTAFFEKSVTVGGVTYRQPWESVSWRSSDRTVTVSGKTLTYSEVMQLVVAIAMQERQAQLNPPPPPPPPPAPEEPAKQ